MASSFFSSLLIIFLLYISSSRSSLTQRSLTGVKLPLIHRLSLPEHSKETTFQQLVETNLKQLQMEFATLDDQAEFSFQTPMMKFGTIGIYFVNVTIGNPPVQQYLLVDTGSSLTWVRGSSSDPPRPYYYNPSQSSTFWHISCEDSICTSNKDNFFCLGKKINLCGYMISYADGTVSTGRIGYDQFGFVTYAEPKIVDKVLFGSLGNIVDGVGTDDENFYGILGLGPESISLVNQLPQPKAFRYCVSNLTSPHESQGYIYFGKLDDYFNYPGLHLRTTRIIQGYHHYTIEIQSICLDNVCLPIDPSVFKVIPGGVMSGVTIDTGAIYSFLPDIAYDVVEDAMIKVMKSKNKTYVPELYYQMSRLCYHGKLDDDESSYPTLTIIFAGGGAKMVINRNVYLHETDPDLHCLSFLRSSSLGENYSKYTIIGLLSQQYHVFQFTLSQDYWTLGIYPGKLCT